MQHQDLLAALDLIEELAKESNLPIQGVFKVIRLEHTRIAHNLAARRSTPEERAIIMNGVKRIYEDNPDAELDSRDIADQLGVRKNQGTLSVISRAKTAFLENRKSETRPFAEAA